MSYMLVIKMVGYVGIGALALVSQLVAAAATGTVTLQGTVGLDCQMTSPALSGSVGLGALDQAGSQQIAFGFSCNAPFGYTMASQNGGLKSTAGANTVVYSVKLSLPTDSGTGISDTCTSTAILASNVTCSFTNSGTEIATNKTGSLDINWQADSALAVGSYADGLTVNIEPLH